MIIPPGAHVNVLFQEDSKEWTDKNLSSTDNTFERANLLAVVFGQHTNHSENKNSMQRHFHKKYDSYGTKCKVSYTFLE